MALPGFDFKGYWSAYCGGPPVNGTTLWGGCPADAATCRSYLRSFPTLLLEPCPQHAMATGAHISLAVVVGVQWLFRRARETRSGNTAPRQAHPLAPSKLNSVSELYWAQLVLSYALFLCFSGLFFWRVIFSENTPLQEQLLAGALLLPWLFMAHSLRFARENESPEFTLPIRIWTLKTLLLTGVMSFSAVLRFLARETFPTELVFDDIFVATSLPFATFAGLMVLLNRTGVIFRGGADELTQPLLAEGEASQESVPLKGKDFESGYASASLWGTLLFTWVSPLLKLGSEKVLEADDVPHMAPKDQARAAYGNFEEHWNRQKGQSAAKPQSLSRALWDTYRGALVLTGVLALFKAFIMYTGPLLLNTFVEYTGGQRLFPYEGLVLVLALFLAKALETATEHQFNYRSELLGFNIRSSLIGALYNKGLKLSSKAKQAHTTGEIVNYMSTDAQRLAELMWELHNIWVLPLQIILALAILFWVVGWAMLAGLGVMLSVMAVNLLVAIKQRTYMESILRAKDRRLKATTEALNHMRVIKLYAWHAWFQAKIEKLRAIELGSLAKFMYIAAVNIFLLWLSPLAVSVATFGCMVFLGLELTPGKVFTAIATFRILQEPLRAFPQVISSFAQAMVSLERLTKFLTEEELQADAVTLIPAAESQGVAVAIREGNFSWEGGDVESLILKNIDVRIPHGTRVAICGSVGAGKSSLLSCMLGEMTRHSGKVEICGSTAYVAQSAWIQNSTIQENILFGLPMDAVRYEETLRCCSLVKDLALFPHGDKTEIGERGINLSGGQKQRIQLARAVYQDMDIYLLDDPFSAVDAHTGTELFMNCIVGGLGSKTVVLVTHQVEFLPAADLILVVREGAIVQSGRYDELLEAGTDFGALVDAHNEAMDAVDDARAPSDPRASGQSAETDGSDERSLPRKESQGSNRASSGREEKDEAASRGAQLIQDEERESGRVSGGVYWAYVTKALRGRHVPVLLLIQLFWQGLQIGSDWWLQHFTSPPRGSRPMSTAFFMEVYSLLAIGSGVFVLVRTVLVAWAGLKTTQAFYSSMMGSVFRAPMAFFDSTPIGRILSRSSTDQATLDMDLPFMYGSLLAMLYALVGILAVTSFVTWPVIIGVAALGYLYITIQTFYLSSSRELSRVNGITKAPIIQSFAESIAGSSTIRAFRQQSRFSARSEERVDTNMKVYFHCFAANEWLGVRLEAIGASLLCFSALLLVVLPAGVITPGLAGLSLSYGLALNQGLFWVVWIWSTLENKMVAVERIQQYSALPTEAPLVVEGKRPPPDWPTKGTLEIRDLEVRYRENMPPVIKGVSLTIKGGHKVGVVGRTGSGKSTLIQTLFRVVEPCRGQILLDGIDICTIGLDDLRSRLSIIPQEPTLFEGTLRSNLDPIGVYSDDEIWDALDKCQLSDAARSTGDGLDAPVQENGENWSVGQRQLACLGRALLKRSRVLVLDEATASVDTKTDAIIQATIKDNFGSSTVISIAHRIPTVIDSDVVLVLEQGEVAEYESPAALLEKKTSMFSKLVAEYSTRSSGMADMSRSSSLETMPTSLAC